MLLSIIVPIYNSEKFLNKCVDSILCQKIQDIEIILVDDGSTDSSSLICDSYKKRDNRVKVFHQHNLGVMEARRKGVEQSGGTYITFVDSDDWVDEDIYSSFINQMQTGIDLIVYGKTVEKRGMSALYPLEIFREGQYTKEQIDEEVLPRAIWDKKNRKTGISQSLCDKIFKRELLIKSYNLAKEISDVHYGEDSLILYPILQWIKTLYISKKCFYHYRQVSLQVQEYVKNDDFFLKAYLWLEYLKKNTKEISNGGEQLDFLYIRMLERRKGLYGDFVKNDDFFFPFAKVKSGAKIILYGAGDMGHTFFSQINRSNYCDVCVWMDQNGGKEVEGKYIVKSTDYDEKMNLYDYCVVAISSEQPKRDVVEWLVQKGFPRDKIVF